MMSAAPYLAVTVNQVLVHLYDLGELFHALNVLNIIQKHDSFAC